jgi:hypothetical protein
MIPMLVIQVVIQVTGEETLTVASFSFSFSFFKKKIKKLGLTRDENKV